MYVINTYKVHELELLDQQLTNLDALMFRDSI